MQQLDKSQLAFCEAPVGNLRLLAPAGCGKTLSLLLRCKHLAMQSKPQRPKFLIVTFTVAARQELLGRLNEDSRFASLRDSVEVTTLNSWGFRRMKNAAFSAKLITDSSEFHFAMLNLLQPVWGRHEAVKNAIEHNKQSRFRVPRRLMDVMDAFKSIGFDHIRHKNQDLFSERLKELREQGLEWKLSEQFEQLVKLGVLPTQTTASGDEVARASDRLVYNSFFTFWREATAQLISNATFTLEDQKYFAYLDERQKLEEGKFLSGAAKYDHVLVDEFQDINPLDLALIKAITERNRATVTIIGDDDQAIFEWRGATPDYILDPERFFGTSFGTYTLGTNYRSPSNIVKHSQQLIAHNQRRVAKSVAAAQSRDAVIHIRKVADLDEALDCVHSEVEAAVGQGKSPSRVAVIGRKRSQIIPYQVYFASREVSFCAAEDLQVFMSGAFDRLLRLLMIKERANTRQSQVQVIDDLLALCNLVKRYQLSRSDSESIRSHIYDYGSSARRRVEKAAIREFDDSGYSEEGWRKMHERVRNTLNSGLACAVDLLAEYRGPLKGANAGGRMSRAMANAMRGFLQATTVSDTLMALADDFEGLQIDLGKAEDDIFYSDPPFLQLAEYASRYGDDYGMFVDDIERAKSQLAYIPPFEDDGAATTPDELWKRPLHLMTALRAKGKEFDTVILLDVNDGIWPNRNAKTPEQLESERRVFYVAFTRAKQKVLMLVSEHLGSRSAVVSPYIEELGFTVD